MGFRTFLTDGQGARIGIEPVPDVLRSKGAN